MAGYKGSQIVLARQMLRDAGEDVERAVLGQLGPEDRSLLLHTTATEWVSVMGAVRVLVPAAQALFPNAPDPMFRLGAVSASNNLRGIYAFVVRVISINALVEQAARLWRTYHAAGEARTHVLGERELRFEVASYPSLPEPMRRSTAGWITQAATMTGAKDVRVVPGGEARVWFWTITWR